MCLHVEALFARARRGRRTTWSHYSEIGQSRRADIVINEDGESQNQRYAVIAEFVHVMNSLEWIKPEWDE